MQRWLANIIVSVADAIETREREMNKAEAGSEELVSPMEQKLAGEEDRRRLAERRWSQNQSGSLRATDLPTAEVQFRHKTRLERRRRS